MSCRSSGSIVSRTKSSTALIRFSVSSMRRPLGRPDVHLERAGVDLGEELAAQERPEHGERHRQQAEADADRQDAVPQDDVEALDVVLDAGVDHLLPAREGPARSSRPAGACRAVAVDLEGLGLAAARVGVAPVQAVAVAVAAAPAAWPRAA